MLFINSARVYINAAPVYINTGAVYKPLLANFCRKETKNAVKHILLSCTVLTKHVNLQKNI